MRRGGGAQGDKKAIRRQPSLLPDGMYNGISLRGAASAW